MADDPSYVPELSRPRGASTIREQLNEALEREASEREKRLSAERDAAQLAQFIRLRAGAKVWAHDDVLTIMYLVALAPMRDILSALTKAEKQGMVPSYTLLRELLMRAGERARIDCLARLNGHGDPLHSPQFLTESMLADMEKVLRDPP